MNADFQPRCPERDVLHALLKDRKFGLLQEGLALSVVPYARSQKHFGARDAKIGPLHQVLGLLCCETEWMNSLLHQALIQLFATGDSSGI